MARKQELHNPKGVSGQIEQDQFKIFEHIALRDFKGDKSKLLRHIIEEYNKGHAEGNDTFTIDKWNDNPEFKAVPTILDDWQKWKSYLENCSGEDFFLVLKNLTAKREQALGVMKDRELKATKSDKIKYVVDSHATKGSLPTGLSP